MEPILQHRYVNQIRFFLSLSLISVVHGVDVASVPQCARNCLSNATSVVASTCTAIDVACLCNSPAFVSAVSCCVATSCTTAEQAVAIQFNIEQCNSVNATAPAFVGCSPLGLTTAVLGSGTVTSFTTASTGSGTAASLAGKTTVSGIATLQVSVPTADRVTADFAGQPLLTGSCTIPFFALIAPPESSATLFPEVGCGPGRQGCCPFAINANGILTKCPQDYYTTADSCCPLGYSIYSTAIGQETPCVSNPSVALVPATTPTISGLTVVTDHVFSKKYILAVKSKSALGPGVIAGIVVGVIGLLAILFGLRWYIRHRKQRVSPIPEKHGTFTFPPQEPVFPPRNDTTSPQELASPESTGIRTTPQRPWPFTTSSPPAYDSVGARMTPSKISTPQELPGSTFIHEHHPVYTGSEPTTDTSPRTPARSPVASPTGSPAVSPTPAHEARAISPGTTISPLGSPKFQRTVTG